MSQGIARTRWFERTFPHAVDPALFPSLIERLRGAPARLAELARTTPREIVTAHVGTTWSIQENLGHLGDLEPLFDGRLDDLLAGRDVLRAADLANRATHEAHHDEARLESLVARFRGRRASLVARLRAFAPADLARTARHPRLGQPMTAVELCHFVAEHDDHHLGRAAELAALLRPSLQFTVVPFAPHFQDAVAHLVLDIQNDELGLGLSLADQPDLADVAAAFAGRGLFLLALPAPSGLSGTAELVGCGGLEPLPGGVDGVLRKMYVRAGWRGSRPGVAQRLFDDLLAHAQRLGLRRLLLDAPDDSPAARRFYERCGFRERSRDGLPDGCHFVANPAHVYELPLPPRDPSLPPPPPLPPPPAAPERYLVLERFRHGDPAPVYRRFHERGRLLPDGLRYITSWVAADLTHCYQVMECEDRRLLDEWMAQWADLVEFEVVRVLSSIGIGTRRSPRNGCRSTSASP